MLAIQRTDDRPHRARRKKRPECRRIQHVLDRQACGYNRLVFLVVEAESALAELLLLKFERTACGLLSLNKRTAPKSCRSAPQVCSVRRYFYVSAFARAKRPVYPFPGVPICRNLFQVTHCLPTYPKKARPADWRDAVRRLARFHQLGRPGCSCLLRDSCLRLAVSFAFSGQPRRAPGSKLIAYVNGIGGNTFPRKSQIYEPDGPEHPSGNSTPCKHSTTAAIPRNAVQAVGSLIALSAYRWQSPGRPSGVRG